VEEICRFELGRWSAAVMKVKPGTFEDMPDARLGVDVRCDGVQLDWYPPERIRPGPIDDYINEPDSLDVQQWVEGTGLMPMTQSEACLLFVVEISARNLCDHIERGGTVDEYCKESLTAYRPRTHSL
jgi:hypothetical protein